MQHCLQLTGPLLIHCEPGGLGVAFAQHLASKHPVSEKFHLKNFLRQQEAHPPFAGFTVRQPPTWLGTALHINRYSQSLPTYGLTTGRCASFRISIYQYRSTYNRNNNLLLPCYNNTYHAALAKHKTTRTTTNFPTEEFIAAVTVTV